MEEEKDKLERIIFYAVTYDPAVHGDRCSNCDFNWMGIGGYGFKPCTKVLCSAEVRPDKRNVIWLGR